MVDRAGKAALVELLGTIAYRRTLAELRRQGYCTVYNGQCTGVLYRDVYSEADMLELAASLDTGQLYREAVTRGLGRREVPELVLSHWAARQALGHSGGLLCL